MTLIQRAISGWVAWRERRKYEQEIFETRRRLRNTVSEYGDLDRQERTARAKHKPTRGYAKARTALVTELLRGR